MDEPFEDDPDYYDWFNPFPMVIFAGQHKNRRNRVLRAKREYGTYERKDN